MVAGASSHFYCSFWYSNFLPVDIDSHRLLCYRVRHRSRIRLNKDSSLLFTAYLVSPDSHCTFSFAQFAIHTSFHLVCVVWLISHLAFAYLSFIHLALHFSFTHSLFHLWFHNQRLTFSFTPFASHVQYHIDDVSYLVSYIFGCCFIWLLIHAFLLHYRVFGILVVTVKQRRNVFASLAKQR